MAILKDTSIIGQLNANALAVFSNGIKSNGCSIVVSKSNGNTDNLGLTDTCVKTERTDTGVGCFFGVGSGGTNHGFYSNTLGRWIVYCNASTAYLNTAVVPSGNTLTISGTLIV